MQKTTRDDLAWEIQEEVEAQVNALTGLKRARRTRLRCRGINCWLCVVCAEFSIDADLRHAGYRAFCSKGASRADYLRGLHRASSNWRLSLSCFQSAVAATRQLARRSE
jgi:hypothetical protein